MKEDRDEICEMGKLGASSHDEKTKVQPKLININRGKRAEKKLRQDPKQGEANNEDREASCGTGMIEATMDEEDEFPPKSQIGRGATLGSRSSRGNVGRGRERRGSRGGRGKLGSGRSEARGRERTSRTIATKGVSHSRREKSSSSGEEKSTPFDQNKIVKEVDSTSDIDNMFLPKTNRGRGSAGKQVN
jgi:hypothetical protein